MTSSRKPSVPPGPDTPDVPNAPDTPDTPEAPRPPGAGADLSDRLARERNVWLCCVRADGSPHVTPVWFVFLRERWWIGVHASSVKARLVARSARVSLALEDGDRPVVAEGEVRVHREDFPPEVVAAYITKYDRDPREPYEAGERTLLLEVGVRRWLMRGEAR
ncbi:pyridoxamine 5'-phosphate oxidase family protein [Streptomyces sp. ST2-7A]|uniref:pyridoxamine 5'-phosphate oxidase family protein n=1 Tax=Streptomyces sp. ST2-7A TaxID=2907214 RepID=UPI001F3335C6|nr:pyridoxamine 5'-phosphate oxidase family protein [Streptomyces sp. ST2-7A]MCE7080972.1 pyridoxamine 5'-phosphate oxidase family protein [Streptomyces sp. ST2-7A]